jgi:hypothetical protein
LGNVGGSDLAWSVETADHVTAEPAAGRTAPGAETEIRLTIGSAELDEGDHESLVTIHTNDPLNPSLVVPLLLRVREVGLDLLEVDRAPRPAEPTGTVEVVLQLPGEFDPRDVLVPSVTVWGELHALSAPVIVADRNSDGVPDLALRFDAERFEMLAPPGAPSTATVTGEVEDRAWFRGSVTLRPAPSSPDPATDR